MKVSDVIESRYLKKADAESEIICTIKTTKLETVVDGEEEKIILYFKELRKGMCLNKTTSTVLVNAYGDEMDGWPGKKVCIYTDPSIQFRGSVVGGLRIKPLLKQAEPAKPKTKKPAAKAPVDEEEFNDEIPE